MSENATNDTAAAQDAPPLRQQQQAFRTLPVVIRKPLLCGKRELEKEEQIAEITLPPGISWQFLVDAIRNDFARVVED